MTVPDKVTGLLVPLELLEDELDEDELEELELFDDELELEEDDDDEEELDELEDATPPLLPPLLLPPPPLLQPNISNIKKKIDTVGIFKRAKKRAELQDLRTISPVPELQFKLL